MKGFAYYNGLLLCEDCIGEINATTRDYLPLSCLNPRRILGAARCIKCGVKSHGECGCKDTPCVHTVGEVVAAQEDICRVFGVHPAPFGDYYLVEFVHPDKSYVFRGEVLCGTCVAQDYQRWVPIVDRCVWVDAPLVYNPELVPVELGCTAVCARCTTTLNGEVVDLRDRLDNLMYLAHGIRLPWILV